MPLPALACRRRPWPGWCRNTPSLSRSPPISYGQARGQTFPLPQLSATASGPKGFSHKDNRGWSLAVTFHRVVLRELIGSDQKRYDQDSTVPFPHFHPLKEGPAHDGFRFSILLAETQPKTAFVQSFTPRSTMAATTEQMKYQLEHGNENRAGTMIGAITTVTVAATIAVILRFMSRRVIRAKIMADDYFTVAALVETDMLQSTSYLQ